MLIFMQSLFTVSEIKTNCRFIDQMLLNKELEIFKLERPGLISDKVRKVEEIRVRFGQLEVRTAYDRGEFKPVELNQLVVS
jgi:hypothetical protein